MDSWLDDLLNGLEATTCEQTLFQATAKFAAGLGFEFCSYCMRTPLPTAAPAVVIFSNHPPAWQAEYLERNYLAVDPTFKHALRSQAALVWSEELFSEAPELWHGARANGLTVGWAQPSRDARNVVGLLTLARSEGDLSPAETRAKQFQFAWLAQTTHLGMSRYLAHQFVPSIDASLSTREIDVLRWTAEGKTASEIAGILDITERTVNFHVNNAVAKLGVSNKTAAAIHAALLGLL